MTSISHYFSLFYAAMDKWAKQIVDKLVGEAGGDDTDERKHMRRRLEETFLTLQVRKLKSPAGEVIGWRKPNDTSAYLGASAGDAYEQFYLLHYLRNYCAHRCLLAITPWKGFWLINTKSGERRFSRDGDTNDNGRGEDWFVYGRVVYPGMWIELSETP